MTSKLKVNIIADGGDNAIITSDGSGSLTINNAALKATPAFEAQGSGSNQTIADNTNSKVTVYNTELYDSNNDYTDNRFTPTVAGNITYMLLLIGQHQQPMIITMDKLLFIKMVVIMQM